MMLNELEIIAWCYTIYLLLTYDDINKKLGESSIVKFRCQDELVIASAIFAKVNSSDSRLIVLHSLQRITKKSGRPGE